jgi:hypothetical protein
MSDDTKMQAYDAKDGIVLLFCFGSYEWCVKLPDGAK